ncbi:MAG TPA: lytic transglycosylase domain-containing protein [Longimicrobiales bacterium]|nr:lytic transglycosylase domain-containing protein [Longimicrobiales bacterium]
MRYLAKLVLDVLRPHRPEQARGPRRVRPVFGMLLLGAIVLVFAGWLGADTIRADVPAVTILKERVADVGAAYDRVERSYERDVAPIERVLLQYRNEPELVRRIAVSLVREGRRTGIEPRLLLAVLLVENPWLNPTAESFVGARGLMQVMPLHRGQWGCGDSLEDVESNICHGAKIFASYLSSEKGNVERALLRYNGCVRGTNTPNCHTYPNHVFARAGRASIMAWRGAGRAAAP